MHFEFNWGVFVVIAVRGFLVSVILNPNDDEKEDVEEIPDRRGKNHPSCNQVQLEKTYTRKNFKSESNNVK
jgi:hypothetical protein